MPTPDTAASAAYNESFYREHAVVGRRSAQVVVPLVLDLLSPRSVVDVGCGVGAWLSVFQEHGIEDFLGLDGPWVEESGLCVPRNRFRSYNLEQPLNLPRTFDLVVSLEVAEHLPPSSASGFVESLVALGPAVLFSAAVPSQGGIHHWNEQWPGYWAALFDRCGYSAVDCVRPQVWSHPEIEWWYAQNILLYVRRSHLTSLALTACDSRANLDMVRRELYEKIVAKYRAALQRSDLNGLPVGRLLRALAPAAVRALRRRLPLFEGSSDA